MIPKGEQQIYKDSINEIYEVRITNMSDKSVRIAIDNLIELYEGRSILYGVYDLSQRFSKMTVSDMKTKLKELGSGVKAPGEIESGDYVQGFEGRVETVMEKRKAVQRGENVGIGTGIRAFDTMIGGLMKAEFGVIAGQPGVGKSATLGSFGKDAYMNGKNVVIVTGEMPKQDFEFRLDSDIANIPSLKFRWGNLSKTEIERWRRSIERQSEIRENFLEIVSFPRNFTAADIEGHILQLQDQYEKEVDLICLDYLNIMNPIGTKYGSKDWQGQAEAVWDVKALCADLNGGVCLWTAGQLKDEGIDSDYLDLSMLKYARAISETAPVVVGLVRTQDDEEENVLEMQVLKMRNAPLPDKSIILRPNLEFMRIHEEVVSKKKDLLSESQTETRRKVKTQKKER
jgi:replicative DNA helicase